MVCYNGLGEEKTNCKEVIKEQYATTPLTVFDGPTTVPCLTMHFIGRFKGIEEVEFSTARGRQQDVGLQVGKRVGIGSRVV